MVNSAFKVSISDHDLVCIMKEQNCTNLRNQRKEIRSLLEHAFDLHAPSGRNSQKTRPIGASIICNYEAVREKFNLNSDTNDFPQSCRPICQVFDEAICALTIGDLPFRLKKRTLT